MINVNTTVHQLAASQRGTIVIVTDVYFAEPTEFESSALVQAPVAVQLLRLHHRGVR